MGQNGNGRDYYSIELKIICFHQNVLWLFVVSIGYGSLFTTPLCTRKFYPNTKIDKIECQSLFFCFFFVERIPY